MPHLQSYQTEKVILENKAAQLQQEANDKRQEVEQKALLERVRS